MMKQSIAFALICSFTISLWAQTFKGRVVDLAGNPIPYAALYLKELKTGFTTDDNGCFQTSLPAGQYTCEVSCFRFRRTNILLFHICRRCGKEYCALRTNI